MKTFVLGFVVGCAACAIVLVPALLSERRSKYDYGYKNGGIAARIQAVEVLDKEFGQYDGRSPYKVLFSVKTADVVSVETNGIKTVSIIP